MTSEYKFTCKALTFKQTATHLSYTNLKGKCVAIRNEAPVDIKKRKNLRKP